MVVVHKRYANAVRSKEIADAARELIAEVGSENLTIRAIAKNVGITQGAIYRHFKSKKDILLRVIDDIDEATLTELNQAFAQAFKQDNSYLDALYILMRRRLLKRNNMKRWIFAELCRLQDPYLNEIIFEDTNKFISHIKAFLSGGVESGEVQEDLDLDAAALLLFSMVRGLINTWGISDNQTFVLAEKYDTMWRVFRNAVTKQESKC
jgi:AcrR family transcriptional regulator